MKRLIVTAVALVVCVGASFVVRAENCDTAFKNLEYYRCVIGAKEYQQGLQKVSKSVCVVHEKITPTEGCVLGPFGTNEDQIIYIVGNISQKDQFNQTKWQCDNMMQPGYGGMKERTFEGHMHPDYTLDKYPGESNSDRFTRFKDNLKNQGKAIFASFGVYTPSAGTKFSEQTCQYYNAKTNTIALKTTAKVGKAAGGGGTPLATTGTQPALEKGMKKLFKK